MKTEVESPVLRLNRMGNWEYGALNPWACSDVLGGLFELDGAKSICFVAKSRSDETTYRVRLDPLGLAKPRQLAYLFEALYGWLHRQIREGRPHIGVRIVS